MDDLSNNEYLNRM